jgi:hypothetical protein
MGLATVEQSTVVPAGATMLAHDAELKGAPIPMVRSMNVACTS